MKELSWYRSWFNSKYYHILYKNRNKEEAALFIDKILKYLNPQLSDNFLDLACGTGRHSITISKKGFDVTGVDLSQNNIEIAKKAENKNLRFYRRDMREAVGNESFNFILNLFTSFGYFSTINENQQVLKAAFKSLKPRGKIVIDYLNADALTPKLVGNEVIEREGVTFGISRKLVNHSVEKLITVQDQGKTLEFKERVWALTLPEFSGLLKGAGFEICDTFGSYNLESFKPSISDRLIIIAQKPG